MDDFIRIFLSLLFLSVPLTAPIVDQGPYIPLSHENGILVEIAQGKGKAPWVRATGLIELPSDKIENLLSDFAGYGEIFNECFASARVLELKPNGARLHIVWRYPIFFRNRDAIVLYEIQKNKNETFRLSWRGDAKSGDPSTGIRLSEVEGSIEIIPTGLNQSRMIYRYIGDLGGEFSQAIKEAAWKRQPEHFFRGLSRGKRP